MESTTISLLTDFFGGQETNSTATSTTKPTSIEVSSHSNKINDVSDESTVSLSIEDTDSRTVETAEEMPVKNIGTVLDDSMEQVDEVMDRVYDQVASICSFISGGSEANEQNTKTKTSKKSTTRDTMYHENHDDDPKLILKRVSFNLTPTFSEDKDFDYDEGDEYGEEEKDDSSFEGIDESQLGIKNQNESPRRMHHIPPPKGTNDESPGSGTGNRMIENINTPIHRENLDRNSSISSVHTVKTQNTTTFKDAKGDGHVSQLEDDNSIEQTKLIIQSRINRRRALDNFDYDDMPFDEAFHPNRDSAVSKTSDTLMMNKDNIDSVNEEIVHKEDSIDPSVSPIDPRNPNIHRSQSLVNSVSTHISQCSLTNKSKVYGEEITQYYSSRQYSNSFKQDSQHKASVNSDADIVTASSFNKNKAKLYEEKCQNSSSTFNEEDQYNSSENLNSNELFEARNLIPRSNIPSSTTSSLSSNLTMERMKKMQERKKRERRYKETLP